MSIAGNLGRDRPMSDDSVILDVLTAVPFLDGDMGYPFIPPGPGKRFTTVANHLELEDSGAAKLLAALRKAGFDVAPINTIRLGQAVAGCTVTDTEAGK